MDPSTNVGNVFNRKPVYMFHAWHGYKLALLLSFAGVIGMVLLLMTPPGLYLTGFLKEYIGLCRLKQCNIYGPQHQCV